MEKLQFVYLPDLVDMLRNNKELGEEYLEFESTIDKPKCSKYWNAKEHLKLFANTFIIEKAMVDLYDLVFNDPFNHYYLHRGTGFPGSDLTENEFHTKIEVKMFKQENKFKQWINGNGFKANHDAEFVLCYCVDTNTVYVVDTEYQTYRLAKKQFEKPVDLIY